MLEFVAHHTICWCVEILVWLVRYSALPKAQAAHDAGPKIFLSSRKIVQQKNLLQFSLRRSFKSCWMWPIISFLDSASYARCTIFPGWRCYWKCNCMRCLHKACLFSEKRSCLIFFLCPHNCANHFLCANTRLVLISWFSVCAIRWTPQCISLSVKLTCNSLSWFTSGLSLFAFLASSIFP